MTATDGLIAWYAAMGLISFALLVYVLRNRL